MKTLIAVPCMDMLPVGFVQSLLYMHKGTTLQYTLNLTHWCTTAAT